MRFRDRPESVAHYDTLESVTSPTGSSSSRVDTEAMTKLARSSIAIIASWLISLAVAVFLLALADFGGPAWVFVVCSLWLCTIGLPTTLSLVALAGVWGRIPGMETPPLAAFAISAATLSLAAQAVCFLTGVRLVTRRRKS